MSDWKKGLHGAVLAWLQLKMEAQQYRDRDMAIEILVITERAALDDVEYECDNCDHAGGWKETPQIDTYIHYRNRRGQDKLFLIEEMSLADLIEQL